ncbi:hypothetical protein CEXT_287891 [Caerostris extrusa]|uniref:Uncharacterized protein n=1 Tax=Caerostris extrusa TaxID=172846 RepID=A0AAV4N4S6_CAEEX|nr:hypothetical protein CEXT_287891 [Caerostris extrusa]
MNTLVIFSIAFVLLSSCFADREQYRPDKEERKPNREQDRPDREQYRPDREQDRPDREQDREQRKKELVHFLRVLGLSMTVYIMIPLRNTIHQAIFEPSRIKQTLFNGFELLHVTMLSSSTSKPISDEADSF